MRQLLKSRIDIKLYLYNLKQYKALAIIYSSLLFAFGPLLVIITAFSDGSIQDPYFLLSTTIALLAITIILIFLTPFVIFNYITTKRSVDVYHSLPIKRSDLFLTLLLTSLTLVIVPFLIMHLLTLALSGIMLEGIMAKHYQEALANLIYIIPTLLAISSIPIIVIANTGTLIDALIHTGVLTVFPFALYGTLSFLVSSFGFSLDTLDPRILNFMSPLSAIPNIFTPQEIGYFSRNFVTSYWFVLFILATCFSLNIFVNRKSERSEEPFVNDWYFPVVAGFFTGLLIILTNLVFRFSEGYTLRSFLDPRSLVFSIIISYVIYAILNFFRYRSVRTILKTTKQYVIILLVSLSISVTLIGTNFMGLTWKVPKAKTVEKIEYEISTFKYVLPIFSDIGRWEIDKKYFLTEEESIQEFVDFHNLVNRRVRSQKDFLHNGNTSNLTDIKDPYAFAEDYAPSETISFAFTYHLKDGDTIRRNFTIPYVLLMELYPIVDNSDFVNNANPIFEAEEINAIDVYTSDLTHKLVIDDLQAFTDGLKIAYLGDMERLTPHELLYKESSLKYIIPYDIDSKIPNSFINDDSITVTNFVHSMTIDTRHTNTIKYLERFSVIATDDISIINSKDVEKDYSTFFSKAGIALKIENYFDQTTIAAKDLDPSIVSRLQGSQLRGTGGDVIIIILPQITIALPLKPQSI